MTSLLKDFIILILVSRISPVVLDSSRACRKTRKFFMRGNGEIIFQPYLSGCVRALRRIHKHIEQDGTIDCGERTRHVDELDCNEQICSEKSQKKVCGSNQEDGTSLEIFDNVCHLCVEGCKQIKRGLRPFDEIKDAVILNEKCYRHHPALVRKQPDTVFCSRPDFYHNVSISCSELPLPTDGLGDIPHLPDIRGAECHNR